MTPEGYRRPSPLFALTALAALESIPPPRPGAYGAAPWMIDSDTTGRWTKTMAEQEERELSEARRRRNATGIPYPVTRRNRRPRR